MQPAILNVRHARHIFALTLITFAAGTMPARAAVPFVRTVVDSAGIVGSSASMALDAAGNPHISYWDFLATDLLYAVREGGTWTLEVVDAPGFTGVATSIEVDTDRNPHISYYDFTNGDLRYAVKIDGSWNLETVDAAGDVGSANSLELDAQGNPHIAYYDATNGDLEYAVKTSGSWTLETVDNTGDVGDEVSLALDASGRPHISYRDVTNGELEYAVKTGGSWVFEMVEIVVAAHTSIALDVSGSPCVSYYDGTNDDLKYATRAGGSWSSEIVDATGDTGRYTSLVLDASGRPHISYADQSFADVRYAVKTGGTWALETVDATGTVGSQTSLVLDAQGNPYICYHDGTAGDLILSDSAVHLESPVGGETWLRGALETVMWSGAGTVDIQISTDGGQSYSNALAGVTGGIATIQVPSTTTAQARVRIVRVSPFSSSISPEVFTIDVNRVAPWWTTAVDTTGNVGAGTGLAIGAHGTPHIVYFDFDNEKVKYAREMAGMWITEVLDTAAMAQPSITLDQNGAPHICYVDGATMDFEYAVKTGGSWTVEVVDATAFAVQSSIALDSQGRPHLAYFDFNNFDLLYAAKIAGSWSLETVDAAGFTGLYLSLALDSNNNPHISYQNDDTDDLRYAVKRDGNWTFETVDTASPITGRYTSIVLDALDTPHISYHDASFDDLRYAVKVDGTWMTETVDAAGQVGEYTSLELDPQGNPHIAYYNFGNCDLKYAVKNGDTWVTNTVHASGDVGVDLSLALDAQGNPHISYLDQTNGDLRYASGAVMVTGPSGGATWPVGATRSIAWNGAGTVDIALSVDGGSTYTSIVAGVTSGSYDIVVPHTPSRFSLVRIERREDANDFGSYVYRHSISESDSLFTIETSVSLLNLFVYQPEGLPGLTVQWNTDPGPNDLDGYRLEKSRNAGAYFPLVSRTTETSYHDSDGRDGDTYRLFAINGLGDELFLGEASSDRAPSLRGGLSVYPLPYQGGDLTIEFATTTVNGAVLDTEVAVYDVIGRRVRSIVTGRFTPPSHRVTWDGKDEAGRHVSSGIYFIRATTSIDSQSRKIVIVR